MMPAIAWAQEIAGHITTNHGVQVDVAVEVFGDVGGIHWQSEIESLGEWEELNMKLLADESLQEKVSHAGEYVVAGVTNDTLVMVVPAA